MPGRIEKSADVARFYEHLCASARGEGHAEDAELRRFLRRVGLAAGRRDPNAAIEIIAAASGDSPQRVREVLSTYCRPGSYCNDRPDCSKCPVAEHCPYSSRKPGIKDMPLEDRPRERLIQGGEDQLSNAELLGIIIRDGRRDATAVDLGARLLSMYGGFSKLAGKSVAELSEIKGIGPAKASQIKAALTIGRRMQREIAAPDGMQFTSSGAVYEFCSPFMIGLKKEVFKVMLLDTKHRLLREELVSEGSLSASVVHPREAFKPAIRESAHAVIFVHNHPSGDPTPSKDDVAITMQMRKAGEVLNIKMLDHIIIGDGRYYSFADEGHLKPPV